MIAPVDVTDVRIETERLILRTWRESDVEDFYEYAKVDGVGQMAGWSPHKDIEESAKILGFFIRDKKTLALELKENGKVIGSLGLEEREGEPEVPEGSMGREIGYAIGKEYWGRGLVPEAVKAVIDYCFKELGFDWLTCGHFVWNHQSRRVVEKCGFRYVKDIIHHTRFGTEELTKLYILENEGKIIQKMTAPFDVTGIEIETQRLILRPWLETDLLDFHEYAQQEEVTCPAGWRRSENLDMSREQLKHYMDSKETFALVCKDNNKVIGSISAQWRPWHQYPIDRRLRGREFGFDLNREYWGMGLMPEAVKAVTEYCFDTLNFDYVTCGHFLDNDQSARCIEKCGFSFLFESVHENPGNWTKMIRTYIQYNPHKEI